MYVYLIIYMSSSRFVQLRANNVASDQTISFRSGFPVLSFTIPAQNGVLDPRSIRLNGNLQIFKEMGGVNDTATGRPEGQPPYDGDANKITMDNRLGIYAMWDQLVIRHDKSKQICENILNYNRYMSQYLGLTSSVQDLTGHMNESTLCQPNARAMYMNVVSSGAEPVGAPADRTLRPKAFSCYLPCGFLMSGQSLNLMENAFGGLTIEIHLSPDSNCLFTETGVEPVPANRAQAFYELSNLSLTCEVHDIPAEELSALSQQTTGEMEFNPITSLYTTLNSTNAQIQYSLGLRYLQSAFLNFVPATHINNISHNGLALTQLSQSANAGVVANRSALVNVKSLQFLKGGVNYPMDFTLRDVSEITGNDSLATAGAESSFNVPDSQLARLLAESVVPEAMVDKTSMSLANMSRTYNMVADANANAGSYKNVKDGGVLYGLGVRLSQFNAGEDYSREQFGISLETDLTTDNPNGVYLYFKSKSKLVYGPSGVQLLK